MKIDEGCIEHNVARLTKEIVGLPLEYSNADDFSDHQRLVTLGYLWGMQALAEALKEVLKE